MKAKFSYKLSNALDNGGEFMLHAKSQVFYLTCFW